MAHHEAAPPQFVPRLTLAEFDALLPNEEACWTSLLLRRGPAGPPCPRCNNPQLYGSTARAWHWQCTPCGKNNRSPYRFSLKTGTIFAETKQPLRRWCKVLHLMVTRKKGISAHQIDRLIGSGTDETAWYMCMRLRAGMQDPDLRQLMGIVEVDQPFVGGQDKNRHWDQKTHLSGGEQRGKIGVSGAIRRKGKVVCRIIENTDRATLDRFVRETVGDRIELVATDEHSGYRLLKPSGLPHESVSHGQGE